MHKSFRELFHGRVGICKFVLDVLMLVGMAPFFFMEVDTITTYGVRRWFSVYNLLDVVAYSLQITITVIHLGRWAVGT